MNKDTIEVSPMRRGFKVVLETTLVSERYEVTLFIKKIFERTGDGRSPMHQNVKNMVRREDESVLRYVPDALVYEVEKHQLRLHALGLDICSRLEYMMAVLPPRWRERGQLYMDGDIPGIRWSVREGAVDVDGEIYPHYSRRETHHQSLRYTVVFHFSWGETLLLREESTVRSIGKEAAAEELLTFAGRSFYKVESLLSEGARTLTSLFGEWAPIALQEDVTSMLWEELEKTNLILSYIRIILEKLRRWSHVKHEGDLLRYRGVEQLMEMRRTYQDRSLQLGIRLDTKRRLMRMREECHKKD